MNNFELQQYVNDHQQQLRQEKAQHDLLNAKTPAPRNDNAAPVYAPALARVGAALVEMGQQLQARYGEAMEAGTTHTPTTGHTLPSSS